MNQTAIAILGGAIIIAGAVLYATGSLTPEDAVPEHRAHVLAELVDPESARFRNERKHPALNIHCGEVNGRNRMGGYSGWQSFTAFAPIDGQGWRVMFSYGSQPPLDVCG